MMYDQSSKLQKIENLDARSKEAVRLSGLDPEEGSIYDIINLLHEEANELIYHFHVAVSPNKHQLLSTYQKLFWSYQKTITKQFHTITGGGDEAEKAIKLCSQLSEECDKLITKMDKLQAEVFPKELKKVVEIQVKKSVAQEGYLKLLRQGNV